MSNLENLQQLNDETKQRYGSYLFKKEDRDDAIRQAIKNGITMYAISQATGMSQTAIAKIRDQGK